ncbi:histone-lysine N-methyltransferase, H3 lysine-79 specific [Patella vulgata]|uniref:histone-lysine N-methyltransferase, H3 lysine-79 specific n=1 Tax=Patella vulgata TaxID=6465 RepID=UPI00217F7660|nr:histone-lysine N-methyltransferase, H3 lysine-79 specific [Patella vulgata]
MKEKTLDKDTIVAYHSFVQQRIRSDLNGLAIGPGWIPCRLGLLFAIFSFLSLITGILIIALRSRHVYLIDWWAQFTGPFFIILFLLFAGVSTYLILAAKRRSNLYRRELFFRPIGDFGVAVVHKSNLQFEQETKPELKSGTTPHRGVLPNSGAYSERRRHHREGRENRGYDDERRGERRERDPRDEGQRRERRERDPRDEGQRRERRERDPRDEGQRRHRDDKERRERDPSREDKERRDRRDRDRNDPREQERRARERKEREARGEMDPREKEYRERRDRERREREQRDRPPPTDESSTDQEQIQQRSEGRRGGRGAPKLPADSSGFVPADRVVLDADFGRPADSSSRASESEL